MANSFITPQEIATEMVIQVRNNLVLGNAVHRDYKKEFHSVGSTVTIDKPAKYVVGSGATATAQDMTEQKTSITVDKQRHVMMSYGMADLTLNMTRFREKHIIPAAVALANAMDADVAALYSKVANFQLAGGTAGTEPSGISDISLCGRTLADNAAPMDGNLSLMVNPGGYYGLVNGLHNVYNEPINKKIMRDAALGRFGGFDVFQSQNIQVHTSGTRSAATSVAGEATTGDVSIGTTGLIPDGTFAVASCASDDTWVVGDVFTVAGVFAVNPISRQTLSTLKRFVVSTAATASTTTATIVASPGMILTGAYQNVSAANASGAALTFFPSETSSAYAQNLAFHKNAFALVTVDMRLPEGAAWATQAEMEGISIRMVKDYTITTDVESIRCDVLYGTAALYPELAVRLSGS